MFDLICHAHEQCPKPKCNVILTRCKLAAIVQAVICPCSKYLGTNVLLNVACMVQGVSFKV